MHVCTCSGSEAQHGDSHLVVSMEQALPVRSEWLNFNRLRIRGERTVPMGPYKLLLCGKGARDCFASHVRSAKLY